MPHSHVFATSITTCLQSDLTARDLDLIFRVTACAGSALPGSLIQWYYKQHELRSLSYVFAYIVIWMLSY